MTEAVAEFRRYNEETGEVERLVIRPLPHEEDEIELSDSMVADGISLTKEDGTPDDEAWEQACRDAGLPPLNIGRDTKVDRRGRNMPTKYGQSTKFQVKCQQAADELGIAVATFRAAYMLLVHERRTVNRNVHKKTLKRVQDYLREAGVEMRGKYVD